MSRDLNQNLYAEEIINESPYYYDDHGRLRMRMLMEAEPMMKPEEKKPEDEKKEPSPEAKKAETPAPAPEKKADGAAATTEKQPLSPLQRAREKMKDQIRKGKPGGGSNINKKPVRPYMPDPGMRGLPRPGMPPRKGGPVRPYMPDPDMPPRKGEPVKPDPGMRGLPRPGMPPRKARARPAEPK